MLFAYRFVDLMCLLVVTNTNWRDKKKKYGIMPYKMIV